MGKPDKPIAERDKQRKTPDHNINPDAPQQPVVDRQQPEGEIEGEGSYSASKAYGDSVKEFVDAGKVEEASERARPESDEVARDIERAEAEGRRRAKEEDPEVSQPASQPRAR